MKFFPITFIFLFLISGVCKSEDKSLLSRQDFVFTIEFQPAFMELRKVILQRKGDTKILSINKIYGRYQKNLIIEKRSVADNVFKQFVDSLLKIDLTKQKNLINIMLDGIHISFRFKTDSMDNQFAFLCPHRSDTNEFQIIKAVINIMERSFKTKSVNKYIEELKTYFDFGLLVKHISDNPLEYMFYGSISPKESSEFYNFMKSLPDYDPIIFDFSSFDGMETMYYPDFQTLIKKNPNVYWLVNNDSKKEVLEIGVNPENIFMNRQKLLKKLKIGHKNIE